MAVDGARLERLEAVGVMVAVAALLPRATTVAALLREGGVVAVGDGLSSGSVAVDVAVDCWPSNEF